MLSLEGLTKNSLRMRTAGSAASETLPASCCTRGIHSGRARRAFRQPHSTQYLIALGISRTRRIFSVDAFWHRRVGAGFGLAFPVRRVSFLTLVVLFAAGILLFSVRWLLRILLSWRVAWMCTSHSTSIFLHRQSDPVDGRRARNLPPRVYMFPIPQLPFPRASQPRACQTPEARFTDPSPQATRSAPESFNADED